MSIGEVLMEVLEDPYANVTFSGGDPLFQAPAFAALAKSIKQNSEKTIWCYTGFTFEKLYDGAILGNPLPKGSRLHYCDLKGVSELLQNVDVIVEGPFVQALRDTDLLFRGSSNQRIIDMPRSLKEKRPIEWRRE